MASVLAVDERPSQPVPYVLYAHAAALRPRPVLLLLRRRPKPNPPRPDQHSYCQGGKSRLGRHRDSAGQYLPVAWRKCPDVPCSEYSGSRGEEIIKEATYPPPPINPKSPSPSCLISSPDSPLDLDHLPAFFPSRRVLFFPPTTSFDYQSSDQHSLPFPVFWLSFLSQ